MACDYNTGKLECHYCHREVITLLTFLHLSTNGSNDTEMSLDYGFVGGTLRKESLYSLIGEKKCFLPLFVFSFHLFFPWTPSSPWNKYFSSDVFFTVKFIWKIYCNNKGYVNSPYREEMVKKIIIIIIVFIVFVNEIFLFSQRLFI